MKKLLRIIVACMLLFTASTSKAQVADGTIAPDFTFTDISGNTQHLYALLDSGFTTYIDVSAAWCGPCWAYHTSGALESLYNTYGPHGTNEVRVMYIEGELSNTINQLNGIYQAPGGYPGSTQGDWVTGTPYPIVDLSSSTAGASTFLSTTGYKITYFPTVYMICPDRTITLVGQATTSQLYAYKGGCSISIGANDAQMMTAATLNSANANLQSCDSVSPTFRLGNLGTTNLTSATITYNVDGTQQKVLNWTGSIPPYNNVLINNVRLGGTSSGTHTIAAIVSNPNGNSDPTPANNNTAASFLKLSNVVGPLISETFEANGIPSNWAIYNGGDPGTWSTANTGYNSAKCAKLDCYNYAVGDIDYFAFDLMSFAGSSTVQLTFDVSYAQASATLNDKLEVDVSTNCGTSWLPRYAHAGSSLSTNGTTYFPSGYTPSQASQWRHETVALNTYAGNSSVLVRFKGTSAQGNAIYVDNINFSLSSGVEELTDISDLQIYPNPATSSATVAFGMSKQSPVTISVINQLGQEMIKADLGNMSIGAQTYDLNTENLNAGLYFLIIKSDNNSSVTQKITIVK